MRGNVFPYILADKLYICLKISEATSKMLQLLVRFRRLKNSIMNK